MKYLAALCMVCALLAGPEAAASVQKIVRSQMGFCKADVVGKPDVRGDAAVRCVYVVSVGEDSRLGFWILTLDQNGEPRFLYALDPSTDTTVLVWGLRPA